MSRVRSPGASFPGHLGSQPRTGAYQPKFTHADIDAMLDALAHQSPVATLPALTEVLFSWNSLSGVSPRYYPPCGVRYVELRGSLVTTGSTSSVFTVRVNGGTVSTLTILSSANLATLAIDVSMVLGDYVQVEPTTAGTGAAKALVSLVRDP